MNILRLTWGTSIDYCQQLSQKIKEYRPQIIVGLSRGGLIPARILTDILDTKLVILGIELYKEAGKRSSEPKITQDFDFSLKGKRVLIVDDVADSGITLEFAKGYVLAKGASEIRCATLHCKVGSKIIPEYFIEKEAGWIVYPWETNEIEREMKKKI
ncbi:phosphoribosyltransferase [Candidatus Micrarchaeota archaeon]|nr:phosphoribosyltransferase [Candidatus Micrarchaeota archaeon]